MTLFIFGFGYCADYIAQDMDCVGTKRVAMDAPPIYAWDGKTKLSVAGEASLGKADAVLISVPPDEMGDPVFRIYAETLKSKKWLGYFSSTAVYGDADGAWVDENTPPNPQSKSGEHRLKAEQQLVTCGAHIFRLSGIYGPGRGPLDRARANAPIIEKPGHVMNRIHVTDIANVIMASLKNPTPGQIYNVTDNEPASSADVLRGAYEALGRVPPEAIPVDMAGLSPMGLDFYRANKRIKNNKIKENLGVSLDYPTWRAGLAHDLS